MLIPYNTDAPLYHPPIATIATMIVNVLLFLPIFAHPDPYSMGDYVEEVETRPNFKNPRVIVDAIQDHARDQAAAEMEDMEVEEPIEVASIEGTTIWRKLTLEYGKFRPWQWLTANYLHGDLFHLLGNLFVLWGFGLVVEGKVGWWRFLLVYNIIGIVGCGMIQMLMFFADEGFALGASLAIFGILAIALVWAPANDMQCVFMAGLRPIVFEASILQIATVAVFLQLAISAFHIWMFSEMGIGLTVTGEIAHLIGGAFGLGIGVYMVKKNLVDCENWDVFSVWAGKNIKTSDDDRAEVAQQLEKIKAMERKKLAPPAPAVKPMQPASSNESNLAQFRSLVAAGKPLDAWGVFCRAQQESFDWSVPEPDFVNYISALRKQQLWDYAAGAMQEYLTRYIERESTIRIALAQIQVQYLNQPREAWQTLELLNPAFLKENEKQSFEKIRAACKQRLAAAKAPKPLG